MRDQIVAIASSLARSAGEDAHEAGADQRTVALACMRAAKGCWLAPEEGEAFAASVAALWQLYPDDEPLRQETRAVGDRNKVMAALVNGVPVDMEAALAQAEPMPDQPLGLIELWTEVWHG